MKNVIRDKNIVLGVCGGIAAYKSIELLRLLVKQEANVQVIMTRKACEFVGPLTFETLSGQPVCVSLFGNDGDASIKHIDWAKEADAVVIAPATANILGKIANGIADDALCTFILAVTSPVIMCPSMNTHMYENRAVQRNIDILEADGKHIIEPGEGELACGISGAGRLPEPEFILEYLISILSTKDFTGKKVLVTAGPTRECIDPVRYISNYSSGKMGYAVARAAAKRGAEVTLVSGPTNRCVPQGVTCINIESALEMSTAVFDAMDNSDVIIKVAAVADYRPKKQADQKIKKSGDELVLHLQKNIDILKELGGRKKNQVLVGFAAETQDLKNNAQKKLTEKNLDIIVGNIVGTPTSGFGTDTNKVTLFFKDGTSESIPEMDKEEVANILLDRILMVK